MPIEFVVGNVDELEEIVKINYIIFSGMYERELYSLEVYKQKSSQNKPVIYLAKYDGKIVGDSISFAGKGFFYVWVLGVLKEYRRKGIATKLLGLNEEHARSKNFSLIRIKVYNVSNEMQRLLLKRGYTVIKEDVSATDEKYNAKYFQLELH